MSFNPRRKDQVFCTNDCGIQYWRKNNKDHVTAYAQTRYNTDVNFRLKACLRTRLRFALKGNTKPEATLNLLGCTVEELKKHLEEQFLPGMTWDNWTTNGWHIDHVQPLSAFDLLDPEQLKKACHYTNLQPLWAEDNIRKGGA